MMSLLRSRRAIATIPRDHEQQPLRLPQGPHRNRNQTSDLRTQSRYTFANRKSNRHVLPQMRPQSSQKATVLSCLLLIAKSDQDESPANRKSDQIFEGNSWAAFLDAAAER
jgi:hypothetical protein